MDEEWIKSYKVIKLKHDGAYNVIDQAIRSEENEKPELALTYYQQGIELIDDALATPVGLPEQRDESWEHACRMIHKMKRTRGEVALRIATLSKKYQPAPVAEGLTTIPSMTFLSSIDLSKVSLELLFSCDKVRLYKINPDGTVSTSVGDSVLRIVRMAEDASRNLSATIFLQVIKASKVIKIDKLEDDLETVESGFTVVDHSDVPSPDDASFSWIYPLVKEVSPCYRTDYGAFILPDTQSEEIGSAVGIVIPSPADEIVLEILEDILGPDVIRHQKSDKGEPRPKSTAAVVSENIVKGAYYVSSGLIKGAEKAGELMDSGTPYLLSKINRTTDDSPAPVTDKVRSGVEIAKNVTGSAVQLTGYLVSKCGNATLALGRFLAPHIQTHGSRLLSHSTGMTQEEASEKVSDILSVAAGAVEGVSTVYLGLEESASILGNNLANNSVKIIEHKYGHSAANVAGTTFDTVGNVINISHNVAFLTPKGFVKKTAKGTGKAIVSDFVPKPGTSYVTAGSLYPDLSELAKEIDKSDEKKSLEK